MSMNQVTVKRSISPDGKIDAVSVEITFEAEITDTQAVLDAITQTDAYATHVRSTAPVHVYATSNNGHGATDGGRASVTGTIQGVYEGEPSKTTGKMGPGAIIIDGTKVKTFDRDIISRAKDMKNNGLMVEATYVRSEKWKSNDLKELKAANA